MDVGYILGHQSEYEELRYSLRSLKHVPHDEVFVAGAPPPDWTQNLHHIPVEQAPLDRRDRDWSGNRKTNMRRNILALLDSPEVSDEFLYMNDDFILVQPLETLPPLPHLGTFTEHFGGRPQRPPHAELYEWFLTQGISDPYLVSEHVPMVVDQRLSGWMREVWHMTGFPVSSLWGNLAGVELQPAYRGPHFDWVLRTDQEHREAWPEHWWSVSTVDPSFHDHPVGEKLRGLFPEPSEYEL